jgi:hypothetical protein
MQGHALSEWLVEQVDSPARARFWLILRRLREELAPQAMFGLRCDLNALPPRRPAAAPTVMTPRDPTSFSGFHDELADLAGRAYVDVFVRARVCEAGISGLFVSELEGDPMYAQWLVGPADDEQLHVFEPCRYPRLSSSEVLLEWAYTFKRFRRLGVMNDGMRQLLVIAQEAGHTTAFTYVGPENVASLRGCANVGFVLDHVRHNRRRLGRAQSSVTEPDDAARRAWASATART